MINFQETQFFKLDHSKNISEMDAFQTPLYKHGNKQKNEKIQYDKR